MESPFQRRTHRRLNQLTGDWVLVSPGRTARPWQGQLEQRPDADLPAYDPGCYMCPGNQRASGVQNPRYTSTFVFDNDFPALQPDLGPAHTHESGLLVARTESGVCRVICFSPGHNLTLAYMAVADVARVVEQWIDQVQELESRPDIGYVQIFENRGAMMGASNPHPHGQIWATSFIPDEVIKEQAAQRAYRERHGADLLGDYAAIEQQVGERVIFSNDRFLCVIPYWATWPFETLLVATEAIASLGALDAAGQHALAEALRRMTAIYDRLFASPFPYTMGLHGQPARRDSSFRLHAHFYPPLLRSATVRKFMVGFELLAMPQRDITPEEAAALLRRAAQSIV